MEARPPTANRDDPDGSRRPVNGRRPALTGLGRQALGTAALLTSKLLEMAPRKTSNEPQTDLDTDLTAAEIAVARRVGELHDVDFAAMAAVSNVYRVAAVVRNHMEREVLKPDQLTWAGFTALFVLWVWGDQVTSQLADQSTVTKGTMTGIVTTLTGRGLVERRPSADDRRAIVVALTPTGRATIRRLFPKFNEHEALVTKRLPDEARRSLPSASRNGQPA